MHTYIGTGATDPSMAWLINAGFSEAYLEQEKMLGVSIYMYVYRYVCLS